MKKLLTLILTLAWCVPAFAVKTNDLPTAPTVSGSTKIIVTVGGTTYNATADQLLALLSGTGYAVAWTNVTGEPLSIAAIENAGAPSANTIPLFASGSTAAWMAVPLFSQTLISSGSSATAVKTTLSLQNVDNTSDDNKPVSSAQQTALDLKQDAATAVTLSGTQTLANKTLTAPAINSPTGIVKGDVGLGNIDNTSDVNKPVSTAQQAALDLKVDLSEVSALGGISKIVRTGTDGDLSLGATTSGTNTGYGNAPGNLLLANLKGIVWYNNATFSYGVGTALVYNGGHDANGGEMGFTNANSLAITMGGNAQKSATLQIGTSGSTSEVINIQYDGQATAAALNRPSKKFTFTGKYWDGTASQTKIISARLNTSGTLGANSLDFAVDDPGFGNASNNTTQGPIVFSVDENGGRTPAGKYFSGGSFVSSGTGSLAAPSFRSSVTPGLGVNLTSAQTVAIVSGSTSLLEVGPTYVTSYTAMRPQFGSTAMYLGADINTTTLTSSVQKIGRVAGYQYASSSAIWNVLEARGNNGVNMLNLGGGSGVVGAATEANFYTGTSATASGAGIRRIRLDTGGLTIGPDGSAIASAVVASASVDFGSMAPDAEDAQTMTVTGALPASEVALRISGTLEQGITIKQVSTGTDSVTIRALNTGTGTVDPAAVTVRALVFTH